MNREELILSCRPTIENLVKKYNNHIISEDLVNDGFVAAIKCIDFCEKNNITNVDEIHKQCNVWVRNYILNKVYQQKDSIMDEDIFEALEDLEPLNYIKYDVRKMLKPKHQKVFDMLLAGYCEKIICEKMNIKRAMYYRYLHDIKEIIKKL